VEYSSYKEGWVREEERGGKGREGGKKGVREGRRE